MDGRFRAAFLAAAVAGAGILLVFFVWHWLNIARVWTVLVEGSVGVALASVAIAWAWRLSGLTGVRGGLLFGGIFATGMLMAELLGLAFGPWPDPTSVAEALPILPFVFVPVAFVVFAGSRLAPGWRGAAAYLLASLVLLVYLGGSVVQRGGTGLGLGLFLILFPGYLAAGALIGWAEPLLGTRGARGGTERPMP